MAVNKKKVLNEIKIFAVMILIVSSLRSALADWNDVPTGSMKPTIQEGDRVVVNKLAYDLKIPFTTWSVAKWGDPGRGDIVVLFSPHDGTRLVKRVIAIPGDNIAMVNNELFINNQRVAYSEGTPDPAAGPALIRTETLGSVVHKVRVEIPPGPENSFAPQTVGPGQYFVMGDNRDNSNDSRYIGTIERRRIVGKAVAVAFSLDPDNWPVPRFDRFFEDLD